MVTSVQQNVSVSPEQLCLKVEQNHTKISNFIDSFIQGKSNWTGLWSSLLGNCDSYIQQIKEQQPSAYDDEKKVKLLEVFQNVWALEVTIVRACDLFKQIVGTSLAHQKLVESVKCLHDTCNAMRVSVKENNPEINYHLFMLKQKMQELFNINVKTLSLSSQMIVASFVKGQAEKLKTLYERLEKSVGLLREERGKQESESS